MPRPSAETHCDAPRVYARFDESTFIVLRRIGVDEHETHSATWIGETIRQQTPATLCSPTRR